MMKSEICILFRCISYFDHLGYSFTPELLTQSRRPGPKGKTSDLTLDLKILEIWKLRFNWRFWKLETDSEAWSFDAFLGFLDVPHETRTQGQLATISADFAKALDKVTASNSM